MIEFYYKTETPKFDEEVIRGWIEEEIESRGFAEGDLMYTFVTDEELWEMNREYLNHDTYTDIITFDYTMGKLISGEIYISAERVIDNAKEYQVPSENELYRVMIHGILHLCGERDETDIESANMREAENAALNRLMDKD